jgi:TonB family protein
MNNLSKRTIVALLCCGASGQAQDPLKLRMSVSYQGAAVAQVFEALASVLGYRLQMDQRVTGSVTLEVRNVTAETALRAVCESVGCRWRIERAVLMVDSDPEASAKARADLYSQTRVTDVHQEIPAQIVWNDAPLDAVGKVLARMLDAELSMDPSLSGKRITLNQNRETAWAALNAICQQAGCRWRMVGDPRPLLLVIPVWTAASVPEFPPGLAHVGEPRVTAPKLVNRARPRYPEAAKQAKVQGDVVVEFVVQPDGTVGPVRVVKSVDKVYGLDAEAAMAARLHVFEPGTKDGKPTPVIARLSFNFALR